MSVLANLIEHLPIQEVQKQFQTCRDGRIKSRWQVIWLRMRGKTTAAVADIVGCKSDWVRQLVRRWNSQGPQGLNDGRTRNGRAPLLSLEQQAELIEILMRPAPDGGLWNGPKVAQWISQKVGHQVPQKRGWIYMRDLGFSSQTPRPRHQQADKIRQEEFKKNSPNSTPVLATFAPKQKLKFGRKTKRV